MGKLAAGQMEEGGLPRLGAGGGDLQGGSMGMEEDGGGGVIAGRGGNRMDGGRVTGVELRGTSTMLILPI